MARRRPLTRSFRSYLMLYLSLTVFFAVMAMGALHFFSVRYRLKSEYTAQFQTDCALVQKQIDNRLGEVRKLLERLAEDDRIKNVLLYGAPAQLRAVLARLYVPRDGVRFLVQSSRGAGLTPRLKDAHLAAAVTALRKKGWAGGEMLVPGTLTYVIQRPIHRGAEVLGVAYCAYRLTEDADFFKGLDKLVGGRFYYLLGKRLMPLPEGRGKPMAWPGPPANPGAIRSISAGQTAGLIRRTRRFGRLFYFISDRRFRREVGRQVYLTAVLGLLLLAVSILVSLLIAGRLSAPLGEMAAQAKDISKGERKGGFDLSNAPFFEFDQVSRTFNDMVAKLSGAEQLEAHARALAEANERLQQEIAERRRAERALKESEERFRSLCENSPDIIFSLETDGSFAYVSPAWAKVLGHRPEEIVGRQWIEFAPDDEAAKFQDMLDRVVRDKETITGVTGHLVHRDGTHRLFSLSGAPNFDAAGQVIGLVGLGRDVTQRRVLELQLQHAHKMEAVGTLAGGVAHDFNNILHVVSGYVQLLLRRRTPDDPDYGPLQDMDDTLKRAGDLVNQLLTFSRKVDSRPQVVDFNDMVRQVVRLLERTIPRMIRIEAHLSPDLAAINIDPTQLERILMNLAGNARDAMPSGGRVVLRTENVDLPDEDGDGTGLAPGRYVRLTVQDNGTGIDHEVLPQIFDPFFTTKEVGRGTGLGLATVYGIVKNHGGDIRVHSTRGEGTTFELYFPALEAEPVQVVPATEDQDTVRGGSETILLVDDEPGVIEIGREILTEYGYSVMEAGSGEKALELIAVGSKRIDLVLLDLSMPGMGGQRCLREIHRIAPDLKVVIASGYGAEGVDGDGLDLGEYDFIRKPFRLHQLLRKVRHVLDSRPVQAVSRV